MASPDSKRLIAITVAISFISGLIGGLIGARFFLPVAPAQPEPNLSAVSQATVTIRARQNIGQDQTAERLGVGLAVKKGGYIITNAHIVKDAKELYTKASGGRQAGANVVKIDEGKDLALLKVDGLNLRPPGFAAAGSVRPGERVYTLGKPFLNSDNYTLTAGIISALPVNPPKGSPTLMQTDAVINPGNSGGLLVNAGGQVVGITTAYLSTGENVAGIGFAIPIDIVLRFVDSP